MSRTSIHARFSVTAKKHRAKCVTVLSSKILAWSSVCCFATSAIWLQTYLLWAFPRVLQSSLLVLQPKAG